MQEQFDRARQLMKAKRYQEARQIISQIDHPNRNIWLKKIDEIESKHQEYGVPEPRKEQSSVSSLSKRPLPLFPGEEREFFEGRKPIDPNEIMDGKGDYYIRNPDLSRFQMLVFIFGLKTIRLNINYFRLKRPLSGVMLQLLHIVLMIAWFPAALYGLLAASRLLDQGSTDFLLLILCSSIVIMLALLPYLVAANQRKPYMEWVKEYMRLRQEYLARK